ncbi:uncharacterized protein LOC102365224 isoform X2 [Latimeria chalumnae]|uniref:uncharacterized protein LOC102365224 isoform X2 n=1 Tax=Latimeria chalumnae TaxID=7897 RepID=UPI0003C10447|nr:PREDICTED: phosphopantothenoylcysteine decarboxylase subunit VHS3-like isoform X3 [Latimeria chalumnae]|eukprot:XP_005992307.1 PREDICTED: phosphopantothenoylcysteine decarboxylase subunit VHS3-like isoform X3 [Latimeria chalumnae]
MLVAPEFSCTQRFDEEILSWFHSEMKGVYLFAVQLFILTVSSHAKPLRGLKDYYTEHDDYDFKQKTNDEDDDEYDYKEESRADYHKDGDDDDDDDDNDDDEDERRPRSYDYYAPDRFIRSINNE